VMITVFCLSILFFVLAGATVSWIDGVGTVPSHLAFLTMLCLIGGSHCVVYYLGVNYAG
jgi:hypothetical protein